MWKVLQERPAWKRFGVSLAFVECVKAIPIQPKHVIGQGVDRRRFMNIRADIRSMGGAAKRLGVMITALAMLFVGAQGARAATTHSDDLQNLNNNVRRALVTIPWYGVFDNLEYTINGTEVVLSGQVVQPVTKHDAENAVKHVGGVTQVVDNVTVLPLSGFDNQIRRAEYRAIFSDSSLGRYSLGAVPTIHIIVNNGHVTLEGAVMNQMDATIARIRALGVPGVFSVTNNLRIG
jgi:hyperosmotically inducible protein